MNQSLISSSLPARSFTGTQRWLRRECLCKPCLYLLIYHQWCKALTQHHQPVGVNMMYDVGLGGVDDVWLWHVWKLPPSTRFTVRGGCVCVLHLPAVADLPRWVTEMVRRFGPVRRTWSTNPPVGPVGMVRRQRMYFWNVCEIWIQYAWAYQHLMTKKL